MTSEKRKQLEDRIESRVSHGYSEEEVREWLTGELDVSPEDADSLVESAFQGKKRAARTWAIVVLLFCLAGIAFGIKLLFDFLTHKEGLVGDQLPIRTLLFSICFILMGATGLASCIPKLFPRKKTSPPE